MTVILQNGLFRFTEPVPTALLGNADDAGELSKSGGDGISAARATPRLDARDVRGGRRIAWEIVRKDPERENHNTPKEL